MPKTWFVLRVDPYPFCWRSDTPLIYRAVPSWFVRVEQVQDELLKNNSDTYWVPQNVQVRGECWVRKNSVIHCFRSLHTLLFLFIQPSSTEPPRCYCPHHPHSHSVWPAGKALCQLAEQCARLGRVAQSLLGHAAAHLVERRRQGGGGHRQRGRTATVSGVGLWRVVRVERAELNCVESGQRGAVESGTNATSGVELCRKWSMWVCGEWYG